MENKKTFQEQVAEVLTKTSVESLYKDFMKSHSRARRAFYVFPSCKRRVAGRHYYVTGLKIEKSLYDGTLRAFIHRQNVNECTYEPLPMFKK